jgi:hypothetical protein
MSMSSRPLSPPPDPSLAPPRAVGVQPSTTKRHLADLRVRSGLSTEQLI